MIVVLMLTTVTNSSDSENLIKGALAARLAACVSENSIRSYFHWKNKVEIKDEIQLLFKTNTARSLELEKFILKNHPYEIPEVISWKTRTSSSYGIWLSKEI